MPEFKQAKNRFAHKGIQWNRAVDDIPEQQICFGRNIRVGQQDSITQRPGLTVFSNLGGTYTHSIARWNNFNTGLLSPTLAYVIGQDGKLFVGDTNANLTNAAINPVKKPVTTGFAYANTTSGSGNPLTMVDMAPIGTMLSWKYTGDSSENLAVGYYPGDTTAGMARCITMGMTPPVCSATVPVAGSGTGLLDGNYYWRYAWRRRYTGARSNPSSATRVTLTTPYLALSTDTATIVLPTWPLDPQTNAADANILCDIYRYGGTINDWRYIATVGSAFSATTFSDDNSDASILVNSTPPEVTDPVTGATRFNLFRPFLVQDNAVYSAAGNPGTITIDATTLIATLTADVSVPGTTPFFNVNWLPGSIISINNNAWTIQQVRSTSALELVENVAGNLTTGTTYAWATLNGTLTAGAPLPHIWGPYGTGQGGAYIFGCGVSTSNTSYLSAPSDAGTLYWTNGNDPDSTDIVNSLIVTSPSEPLRGGCIYDGTPFVWSTERMFRIYPGSTPGQFVTQEIPGGKGIWAEYSLTVQSNGIADQSVTWVGKDGIYDWSSSGGLQCMTDRDLYPFFPHDNQVGQNLATIFPFISNETHEVNAPNFASGNMKYHRLCWFMGELFYDYPCLLVSSDVSYNTLVYDSKQTQAWVSVDQYSNGTAATSLKPVCRGIEIAANNMKLGIGGVVLDYTGTNDAGTALLCRLITRQDDLGDARGQKLFGDYMFDATAGNSSTGIVLFPLTAFGTSFLLGRTISDTVRTQNIYSTSTVGLGVMGITFGLDMTWTCGSSPVILYQYEYSYVPKPTLTNRLATDKTDDGYNGAKYLRGVCIEAITTAARTVKVLVDDDGTGTTGLVATLTVNTGGTQLELPFAITPVVGSEFQLAISTADTNTWQLFQVRWIWEKWPDLTIIQSNWLDMGTPKPKYVRGFQIPVSGPATPTLTFTATYDGASTYVTSAVAPVSLTAKSPAYFAFLPPILAHQLKLTPSTPCRVFYDQIKWDAEEWPEKEILYGPVENLGTSGAKYLRGFELPIETNAQTVAMVLNYDVQPTQTTGLTASEAFLGVATASLSKNVFPFTPANPIIAHEFQLASSGAARFWYQEVKWDFEPWPEFSDGVSAWMDAGTPGAKFMQGLVVALDTGGLPVTFDLVYTGGSTGADGTTVVGPFTTTTSRKTPVPFSFPTPIIMHEMQLVPRSPCRVWYEEIKWVWEPLPELVTTYSTQATDHDLPGYHYLFDAYIAYIGTAAAPTFTVTTEYGSTVYTLPVSNGVYTRAYLLLNPSKAKWRSYHISCSSGIRLYLKDCEVRVKNWTDKGQYPSSFQSKQPFGDESRVYGARI